MTHLVRKSAAFGAVVATLTLLVFGAHADDDYSSITNVTYSKDIAPIVQENCQGCHRPGQIAPMSLMSYQEMRPWAKAIKKSVVDRTMPPYFAHPSSFEMKGDLNLTDEEIAKVVAWVDRGAPEGDRADLPEPRSFDTFAGGWTLREPDLVLQPAEPFLVGKEVDDEYRCYAVALGLEHDIWLKGAEFRPGNSQVVHHFILFEDIINRFAALDDSTPEPGIECSDMEKVLIGTKMLKMWAPGNIQPLSPRGVGNKISAGSDLILQIHYHNVTGGDAWDHSSFALHLAQPDETIMKQVRGQLVNQMNINIKAGDPNSRHEATVTTREAITIYSAGVHMHYRGKNMGLWMTEPGKEEETVLWVPNYDFNWQLTYEFAEPRMVPRGTVFKMVSHHDNSADNPFNPDPTKDVHFGLETSNEMSFSGYSYTVDSEELNITPRLPAEREVAAGADAGR